MPTRFAPSPTGFLHIGHAYSALTAWDISTRSDGKFILRIEDIDYQRCKDKYEKSIFEDMKWLGMIWLKPVINQKNRLMYYQQAIEILDKKNLVYPCSCSRKDLNTALLALSHENSQVNCLHTCRTRSMSGRTHKDNIRLNIDKAISYIKKIKYQNLTFVENFNHNYTRIVELGSQFLQDDIVIARKDIGTSYHLSVVVDDAYQNITHVVRGNDLLNSTPVQRLLQIILKLPEPRYHHHKLITDDKNSKLAKKQQSKSLRSYIEEGLTLKTLKKQFNF